MVVKYYFHTQIDKKKQLSSLFHHMYTQTHTYDIRFLYCKKVLVWFELLCIDYFYAYKMQFVSFCPSSLIRKYLKRVLFCKYHAYRNSKGYFREQIKLCTKSIYLIYH